MIKFQISILNILNQKLIMYASFTQLSKRSKINLILFNNIKFYQHDSFKHIKESNKV